ncbi:AfsR/SARP family transcriptional regulator [Amycolatopsis jiangsuensis]|uniref:DNA-binding SARP family transcriptional activator/DNA polymerase III delta prime subunit n=1 Tax=Amycolatopsis jiangsuensis TaxID=1181879 RepID=A0A840ITW5_9PSEU|nr:BTAD domain-containing putative transcriptional regulator [Amycolatopsis jiangsuensis]MBB4684424.1 DNA-binding SARP family transcriptional activator/DNA polymerase III delta prime subunit [Amycolatopsis jiangsuensis]
MAFSAGDESDGVVAASFRVLGPLEVSGEQGAVSVAPGRQEIVLGALVLELNRVVETSYLVDVIWPDDPPKTARTQVQICVSRLRKALSDGKVDASIETRPRGYFLRAPEDATDLGVFGRLVTTADALARDGRKAAAVAALRSAISLWRGRCLAGLPSAVLAGTAAQLDQSRLEAVETCLRWELELGRHERLIGELQQLVAQQPLRDRPRGYLMLALYRSGRPAEALDVYHQGRALSGEKLGLAPGKELRRLAQAILTDDAGLVPAEADEPSPAEATSLPEPETCAADDPVITPRQLPADIGDLVADGRIVSAISGAVTEGPEMGPPNMVVLLGGPGVGKSTLARHVAHRLAAEHFPDGQLYCVLRGPGGQPVDPAAVLGRFLRALGVPGQAIPDALDERAEMYRSLLADRRVLVVLDDAVGESQLRVLQPGAGRSGVLVTSRGQLTGLPGARRFELESLSPEQGIQLLGRIIGEQRVECEREAARSLIRLVGGLPLALRIIGARLAARPHRSLTTMWHRLEDEQRRLDELTHGELSIRASLSVSYYGLARTDRRLLCMISLAEGAEIPSWLGAALIDDRTLDPADLLEPLIEMRLLDTAAMDQNGEFRCGLSEIVRTFAQERLRSEISEAEQVAAVRRMVGGWMALVDRAHHEIYGGPFTIVAGRAERWQPPEVGLRQCVHDPLGWLETEQANLVNAVELAARCGLDELCWQLATALVTLFEARGYPELWERTHQVALAAAQEAGNERGRAAILASLGTLHLYRGEYEMARPYLGTALEIFERLREPTGQALCLRDLACIERHHGDDDRALVLYESAERNFVQARDVVGRAYVLGEMAHITMRRADFVPTQRYLDEALGICRSAGFERGQALVLRRQGQMMIHQQRYEAAERTLLEVLAMVGAYGDLVGEGYVLHDLGRVNACLHRVERAVDYYSQSARVRERILDHRGAAAARADIVVILGRPMKSAG